MTKPNPKACQNPSRSISKTKGFFIKCSKLWVPVLIRISDVALPPRAVLDLGSLSIRRVGGGRRSSGKSAGKFGRRELLPNSAPKRMHQRPVPTGLKRVTKSNSLLVEVEKPFGITCQNLIYHLTQPFYPEFSIPNYFSTSVQRSVHRNILYDILRYREKGNNLPAHQQGKDPAHRVHAHRGVLGSS